MPLCRAASDPEFNPTCEDGLLRHAKRNTLICYVYSPHTAQRGHTQTDYIRLRVCTPYLGADLSLTYNNIVATIVSMLSAP